MPRHCPAVVESPHHSLAASSQIIEKQLHIHIISVKIVQMHHIGRITLNGIDQTPCSAMRHEAIIIGNTSYSSIEAHRKAATHSQCPAPRRFCASSGGYHAVMTATPQFLADSTHHTGRTPDTEKSVHMENAHRHIFIRFCYFAPKLIIKCEFRAK